MVLNKHLIKDPYNPQCICENLFYKDNNGIKCLAESKNEECRDMETYTINLYGTKECLSSCNGVLSPTGDICHPENYKCEDYPNSEINNDKCVCKDKYYIDSNRNVVCLEVKAVCPKGYQQRYVPSIKQCLKDGELCPSSYNHLFINKYCLSECPNGVSDNTCDNCASYWEMGNDGKVTCKSECSLYIPSESKKCVNKCKGQYSYNYGKECYSSCDRNLEGDNYISIINSIDVINPDNKSTYKCVCKEGDFWYIYNNKMYCVSTCFPETEAESPSDGLKKSLNM